MDSWKSFYDHILNWKNTGLSTSIHKLLNILIPWFFWISRIYAHSFITQVLDKTPYSINYFVVNSTWKTRRLSDAKVRSIHGSASFPEKMNIPRCDSGSVFNRWNGISTLVCGKPELRLSIKKHWKIFNIYDILRLYIRIYQNSYLFQSFDNHFFSLLLSIHH